MFNILTKLRNRVLYNCAIMSTKFNTYHEFEHEVSNFMTGEKVKVLSINQFVTTEKRNPNQGVVVSYWRRSIAELEERLETKFLNCYLHSTKLENKTEKIDFYFPDILEGEYPGLLHRMGPPDEVYQGILGTSGRSIWILRNSKPIVCLKIDTMQLNNRLFFNERSLYEVSLVHAQRIGNLLKSENNIFFENFGASAYFKNLTYEGETKRYTYLIRELNFSLSRISPSDFLIPLQVLGSSEFWNNESLLKAIGIKTNAKEFFEKEVARCLADLIRHCINNTAVHLEAHMQNMTLQIRNGRGIKFIYHDLQDTMFDPTIYFCNRLITAAPNSEKKFNAFLAEIYGEVEGIQSSRMINSQGERIFNPEKGTESCNVSAYWRKYVRNTGDYTRIFNFLTKENYLQSRRFEDAVLEHFNFTDQDLELQNVDAPPADLKFLKNQLYWCVDRYYKLQQSRKIKEVKEKFLDSFVASKQSLSFDSFFHEIQNFQYVASLGIPIRPESVQARLISAIYNLWNNKIFYFLYDGKPVILIKTSITTPEFKFSGPLEIESQK